MSSTTATPVEVRLEIDPDGYADLERLKDVFESPNLATAMYNAASIVLRLCRFQRDGWELQLARRGDVRRFRLPID